MNWDHINGVLTDLARGGPLAENLMFIGALVGGAMLAMALLYGVEKLGLRLHGAFHFLMPPAAGGAAGIAMLMHLGILN